MRLDFTLNIPTILSLLATVVALVSSGITLYNGLDKRQMTTEFKIDKLDQRVEKNETAVVNLREEQSKREATLRAEMKGDVAEIKDLLNRLYYGPSVNQRTQQRELNEWRK
jgi:DNA-binding protein H-NS